MRPKSGSRRLSPAVAFCSLLLLLSGGAEGGWISDVTGVHVDPLAGHIFVDRPHPEHIPDYIRRTPETIRDYLLHPGGPALAGLIRQARSEARGTARPMPPHIRSILAPFFPPAILNRARFTTRAHAGVSLATTTLEVNGDVAAMTLDDIIVFDSGPFADDPIRWAHELVHVTQYRNLGIDGFAGLYAGPGYRDLEDEAYAWESHVSQQLQSGAVIPAQWSELGHGSAGSWDQIQQAAVQLVPPDQCAQWTQISPDSILVTNICAVPLTITHVEVAGRQIPCTFACRYAPGEQRAMGGAVVGPVNAIWFRY
jgi:hypothetical protein